MKSYARWIKMVGVVAVFCVFSFLATAPAVSAEAAEAVSIGNVSDIEGSATSISQSGTETILTAGAPVFLMDRIITAKDGKVGITFKDSSYIAVGQDSEMTVDTFIYKPKSSDSVFSFSVVKGMFLVFAGKIARSSGKFTAVSPTAVVGVRGTSFALTYRLSKENTQAFNKARESEEDLTLISENLYSVNLSGGVYVENEEGRVTLEGPCPYCMVASKGKKLAFVEGPEDGETFMTDDGRRLTAAPSRNGILLAQAGYKVPAGGYKPVVRCNLRVAKQFSTFFKNTFRAFSAVRTAWVAPYLNYRSNQINTSPAPSVIKKERDANTGGDSGSDSGGY